MRAQRRPGELIRAAHGDGASALVRVERTPLDEGAPPNADDTERGLAAAKRRGRPFTKGNHAASNRKPVLALMGVSLQSDDPRCTAALRKAERLRQRRVRELTVQHGGYLGAGPCSMLGSAYRALAASTVLYALASEALAGGRVKEASDLFSTSARLADSSRQQELTAIAIAEREHAARAPASAVDHQAALRARMGIVDSKEPKS